MRASLANWIAAERGRFILLCPVATGAAILLYFALPAEPPLWLGAVLVALSLAALAACWRLPPARFAAALAVCAALGFARAELRTASLPPPFIAPSGPTDLSGVIARIEPLPSGERLLLAAPRLDHGAPLPRGITLLPRPDDTQNFTPGARIAAEVLLFTPGRPAYPGAWDAARQDYFAGIGATAHALAAITILAPGHPGSLSLALQTARARIAATIMATLPIATGSIATTLLTGDEQAIPEPERQNFIAAGLAHILAVAGLHVGIVMGLFFAATRFLLTRSERLALRLPVKSIAAIAALAAGAGYAALTGAHLPILRSLAMASLVTLGVLAGRRAISLRGLALAAMLILLTTPEAVIGTSFQMSFSAVLALIAGYEAWQRRRKTQSRAPRFISHIAALAFTSLLAGGASMPFAAFQFQQMQPYWIPANLVAVPLTALWIMPLGLVALALIPFGLAAFALIPMGWGIAIIVWLTARIAAWPATMLRVPPMPPTAILLFTAGLIWLCLWRTRPRLAGLPLMAAALAIYLAARPPDVLVSPDAKLIALKSGNTIYLVTTARNPSYTLAQWAPVWGGAPLTPAQCSTAACRIGPVLFALAPPSDCTAALIVAPIALPNTCPGLPAITRASIFTNGAIAAWVQNGRVTLRTDRAAQGNRPWVVPYPSITTSN